MRAYIMQHVAIRLPLPLKWIAVLVIEITERRHAQSSHISRSSLYLDINFNISSFIFIVAVPRGFIRFDSMKKSLYSLPR